jgi:hypothetical protein
VSILKPFVTLLVVGTAAYFVVPRTVALWHHVKEQEKYSFSFDNSPPTPEPYLDQLVKHPGLPIPGVKNEFMRDPLGAGTRSFRELNKKAESNPALARYLAEIENDPVKAQVAGNPRKTVDLIVPGDFHGNLGQPGDPYPEGFQIRGGSIVIGDAHVLDPKSNKLFDVLVQLKPEQARKLKARRDQLNQLIKGNT